MAQRSLLLLTNLLPIATTTKDLRRQFGISEIWNLGDLGIWRLGDLLSALIRLVTPGWLAFGRFRV